MLELGAQERELSVRTCGVGVEVGEGFKLEKR
jgi:hypothetical protein